MDYEMNLNEQNKATVMLVQALWGAISPNFRLVALAFSEPIWQLMIVLEDESAADREEIEEVVGEFDSLLSGMDLGVIKFHLNVVIDNEPLPPLDPSLWRLVFRRREN